MTTEEFNRVVEELEINMLQMTPEERFDILVDLTRTRHKITRKVYYITELLVLLEMLGGLKENYVNLSLCRIIVNQLIIH